MRDEAPGRVAEDAPNITFTASTTPRASVIILGWRTAPLLLRCLRALQQHAARLVSYEVIVFLNEPDEALLRQVQTRVRGAKVACSRVNLGFGGGNNEAATIARGEFLVLLNDDAVVEPGWLDALVAAAEAHPDAGAVCGRILFPDGTLQEAGSIVWNDGTTYPVGIGSPPDSRAYMYAREVDYGSACSLLVRRASWQALGGFDDDYFPAYYEDLDLCMGIRRLGGKVIYTPRAVVRHERGASSELDSRLFLAARNRKRFCKKWADELKLFNPPMDWGPAAVQRAIHRARGYPLRVLLLGRTPTGAGEAARPHRILEIAYELNEAGYAVSVLDAHPADEGSRSGAKEPGSEGIEVIVEDGAMHLRRPEVLYDAVLISGLESLCRHGQAVRLHQPQAALIYFVAPPGRSTPERLAELTDDSAAGKEPRNEAARLRPMHQRAAVTADYVVGRSEDAAAVVAAVPGHTPVVVDPPCINRDAAPGKGDGRRWSHVVEEALLGGRHGLASTGR